MEQAIYGGRIDNDHDIRVVTTYLHKYFQIAALPSPAAPASVKLTVGVELPISNKYEEFVRIIQALPNTDAPGVFALAPNVDGAVQQTQSSAVVSQLRKLAVSSQLSSKFDREAWRTKVRASLWTCCLLGAVLCFGFVESSSDTFAHCFLLQLSPLLNLWDKLAVKSDKGVLSRPPKSGSKSDDSLSPVDSFVVLENQRVYEVLVMVGDALGALNSVVYGSGLLTPQIRDDALALLSQQVPNRCVDSPFPAVPSRFAFATPH
jgi:dynein heavy chain 2